MKRNILKTMALVLSMLLILTALAGCAGEGEPGPVGPQGPKGEQGVQGDKGDAGQNGKSAYELAKENGYTFANPKTDFTDFEEVSDYAKEAVSMLAGEGIINGMGDGSFAPKKETTRAQAAKLMYAVIGGKN